VPSPFDCWLLLRGVKTLALRVERQSQNAMEVASALAAHPAVKRVYYPGLDQHPNRAVAARQMRLYGGMVSFEVADEAVAFRTLERLKIFALAESLGAVESLAEHPARMTHASIPAAERKRSGVGDGLIRLSIGPRCGRLVEDRPGPRLAAGPYDQDETQGRRQRTSAPPSSQQ
jgi:cystathionine beta-lyase/cystathionine gamma-synthase